MQNAENSWWKGFWHGLPERFTPFLGGLLQIGSALALGVLISGNPEYLYAWFSVVLASMTLCAYMIWIPHIENFTTRVLRCRPLSFYFADLFLFIIVQISLMWFIIFVIDLDITIWNARLGRMSTVFIAGLSLLTLLRTYRHAFYLFWESEMADGIRRIWCWLKDRVEGGPAWLVVGGAMYLVWVDMNHPSRLLQVFQSMLLPSTLLISMIAVNIIWSPHRQKMHLGELRDEIRIFLNVALVIFGVLVLYLISATKKPFPDRIPQDVSFDTAIAILSTGFRSMQALSAGVVGGGLVVILVGFARMGKEALKPDNKN